MENVDPRIPSGFPQKKKKKIEFSDSGFPPKNKKNKNLKKKKFKKKKKKRGKRGSENLVLVFHEKKKKK